MCFCKLMNLAGMTNKSFYFVLHGESISSMYPLLSLSEKLVSWTIHKIQNQKEICFYRIFSLHYPTCFYQIAGLSKKSTIPFTIWNFCLARGSTTVLNQLMKFKAVDFSSIPKFKTFHENLVTFQIFHVKYQICVHARSSALGSPTQHPLTSSSKLLEVILVHPGPSRSWCNVHRDGFPENLIFDDLTLFFQTKFKQTCVGTVQGIYDFVHIVYMYYVISKRQLHKKWVCLLKCLVRKDSEQGRPWLRAQATNIKELSLGQVMDLNGVET